MHTYVRSSGCALNMYSFICQLFLNKAETSKQTLERGKWEEVRLQLYPRFPFFQDQVPSTMPSVCPALGHGDTQDLLKTPEIIQIGRHNFTFPTTDDQLSWLYSGQSGHGRVLIHTCLAHALYCILASISQQCGILILICASSKAPGLWSETIHLPHSGYREISSYAHFNLREINHTCWAIKKHCGSEGRRKRFHPTILLNSHIS